MYVNGKWCLNCSGGAAMWYRAKKTALAGGSEVKGLQLAFFAQAFAFFAVFAHEFARERIVAFDAEDFAA